MSRFVIPIDPAKQKKKLVWDYITLGVGVLLVVTTLFFDWRPDDNERLLSKVIRILCFTFLSWNSATRLFSKRYLVFAEINDQHISFRMTEWGSDKEQLTTISWEDIKWIKQENDFSVSVFQASSFNANFSIKMFLRDDQEKILQEIQAIAEAKQVKLVNFSELLVWQA